MKTYFITIIYIVFACTFSNAQEPPTPPATPSTSNSSSRTTTRSSTQTDNTSISISYTEDDYKLRARFPKNRYEKLKTLIQNELGGKNMDIGRGYSKWSNDEKVYEIKLTEKSLRIWLDLTVASEELTEKFTALGKDAKIIISGNNANVEKERMQREADRMRREADRMQLEAKRLERQAKRVELEKERIAKRVEREVKRETARVKLDAKRIEREAKRLDLEAKRIEKEARHKGGVGTHIKRLLNDSKTTYTANSGKSLNWIWPAAQTKLIKKLKADGLIDSDNEITLTSERDKLYVNGKQLSERQNESYRKLFLDVGIQSSSDFSFYKKGNHIVVIGLNAKIKKVFQDLHNKGFIASTDEAVKLLIDGNSITQNGTVLSNDKVATYNAILRDNGIIPAPGKYIEMKKAGSYRLGYSLEKNGIVGTWIEED